MTDRALTFLIFAIAISVFIALAGYDNHIALVEYQRTEKQAHCLRLADMNGGDLIGTPFETYCN